MFDLTLFLNVLRGRCLTEEHHKDSIRFAKPYTVYIFVMLSEKVTEERHVLRKAHRYTHTPYRKANWLIELIN